MFNKVNPKQNFPEAEHNMLEYWKKNEVFKKSVEKNKDKKKFVFFDGPPFANGLPHYGHILALSLKDAVTRYFNMKGYYVPRTNGWDCHGLPVEYEIEKELSISGKKAIEEFGVSNFNQKCKESVFRYTEQWEKLFERIGRFVDLDQSYATKENSYMESIWWVFKQIYDKKMVYSGHKPMHICPRCATPLSNFEVSLGYKDVTDLSVTLKFKVKDEANTYILAWTTTPWTLPGNSALAVGSEIVYAKVKFQDNFYILAKNLLNTVLKDIAYEIVEEFVGEKLKGKKYEPLFTYYVGSDTENIKKSYRVITANFVSIEEGTGVIHIAPSFGEDDLKAGIKNKLAMIQHVDINGCFKPEVVDFAGKFVKTQDQNITNYLEVKGLLFKKENFRHSYPHCWRCDTPLLNYTTKSWFIKVTGIKNKLLKNNKKIAWQPPHIKEGRFGKWLENVRDWSISRNRYWGAPLPIWECKCGEFKCAGSIDELSKHSKNGIRVIATRHGEYISNLNDTLNSNPQNEKELTEKGESQALNLAQELKDKKIDLIICSQLLRAKKTAEIISKTLNIPVKEDKLLNEHQFGEYEDKSVFEYQKNFNSVKELLNKKISPEIESLAELIERMKKFNAYLREEYKGKTILLITHGDPIIALESALGRITPRKAAYKSLNNLLLKNCEYKEFWIGNDPIDSEGNLDLHKPYIDKVYLDCDKCGSQMERIPEVFDCWFESGAMPYAQLHYPFDNKEDFENNFPANFIAEGLDQTRGWFYTLHVLSTILFNKPAFKNVIVNGILLAADGEKLSKRKKNYPDPNDLFEKFGVDSMRYFLYSSTAPLAEDVRFSEKHVEEIVKGLTLTLWNTYSFFTTYALIDKWEPKKAYPNPKNKLDKWILSELQSLIKEMTENMDSYNLTQATRPIGAFIDNLSNWYIRRSRRRFWKSENDTDKKEAYAVLYEVLKTLTLLLAPFMPFLSDEIYQNLTKKESVHLESWPKVRIKLIDEKLNQEIRILRKIVELGHSLRASAKIKVRQPLSKVLVALPKHISQLTELEVIKEELNVKDIQFIQDSSEVATCSVKLNYRAVGGRLGEKTKKVTQWITEKKFEQMPDGTVKVGEVNDFEIFDPSKEEIFIGFESSKNTNLAVTCENGIVVALDTEVTENLKKEGIARDLIRYIQEMRKKANFNVDDRIYLYISSPDYEETVTEYSDFIKKETLSIEIQQKGDFQGDLEENFDVDGKMIKIAVRR